MARSDRELEIGPSGAVRRLFGWLAFFGLVAVLGAAFVWLFVLLTHSWQIAVGSATVLIGFMALCGWLAERSSKSDNGMMR